MSKQAPRCVTWPVGFRAAGGPCGIKPSGSPDLALVVADQPCAAAGMFTRTQMPGAPVIVSRKHIRKGRARAIVCNSGCSNVCTGGAGVRDAISMCRRVAQGIGVDPHEVLVCSTGVIGHRLPMDKIERGIDALLPALAAGPKADADAARAIMTTDLKPKTASTSVKIDGVTVRIGGMCKGSGMIAPNMATMLVFITTDADVSPAMLKLALKQACEVSFNRISVDLDTSTSDSLLLLASGCSGAPAITGKGKAFDAFAAALTEVCRDLAYQVIRDGEGATKVFRVSVKGARSKADAAKVGYTVVGSPLVKTAIHGGDPNWGRLVAATGRSGAKVVPARLRVAIGGIVVCDGGKPATLSAATQRKLVNAMKQSHIEILIDLGLGDAEDAWLGCDLSKEYVTINADYTT
ncbi:MAG: bifunctional glutamate N-acetyltransferase/amino-acid acetyltransferase ArgJ [Phycisphaeraceae bacterium]|nr:bifunctional glutamate N-acetyltransferase/amino-acid acetyltransferase ArgJ [Phycisphaeraceae bacterium]